ncbi:hypothetical protein EMIT0111MI5_110037 [Burkholderia sp. IT-111MI5]
MKFCELCHREHCYGVSQRLRAWYGKPREADVVRASRCANGD